jgi:hypothetical protein
MNQDICSAYISAFALDSQVAEKVGYSIILELFIFLFFFALLVNRELYDMQLVGFLKLT